MEFKMMRAGLLDERILKESSKGKRRGCIEAIISRTISFILCVVLLGGFCFSLYINKNEDSRPSGVPVFKVVKSESMAKKNEKNGYLWGFELNDQIQMFDVILTHHLPAEEELELYDVVVYKRDDISVIHRIVEIEEPNEEHSDHRLFIFQGDAIENPDRFPVLYSQMQGIYKGERIPFVGSLIIFLQSPAGWLCLLLVLFAAISTPMIESRYKKEMKKRLAVISSDSSPDAAEEKVEENADEAEESVDEAEESADEAEESVDEAEESADEAEESSKESAEECEVEV